MSQEFNGELGQAIDKLADEIAEFAERLNDFSIELDAPPFQPRPNELIVPLLDGINLTVEDFDTSAPFFGHQAWILKKSAGKDDLFTKAKPILKERIELLFDLGLIRYGTW